MRSLFGALLWSLFLLFALVLYHREEKRRLAEYRGLCRLTEHLRLSLAGAPMPLSLIYERFSDDALAHAGFLSSLKSEGLLPALASKTLHLDDDELRPFQAYAEGLGNRLYVEEQRATENLLSDVTEILRQKEAAFPRKKRLTGTLFFTGGMMVLLLLL